MELLHTDTLEEARRKLEEQSQGLAPGVVEIGRVEALGCICAEDVVSEENVPPFPRSTMDGYAIKAADSYGTGEASPGYYRVIGHVHIEEEAKMTVEAGEAVRVQTGSMIPRGADAVLMREYAEEYVPGKLAGYRAVSEGENIIRAGEDIRAGGCVIYRGKKIGPADIGVMAALGIQKIRVCRAPVVTVISTGDELAGAEEKLMAGKIRDINTEVLAAEAEACGMAVRKTCRVPDDREEIRNAVEEALDKSDVILLSGGSSKGEKDYTKQVFEEISHNVFTHGIAIKPGKPTLLAFDPASGTILAGLPGHPMAAALIFRLVIRDWYLKRCGAARLLPCPAVMAENVSSNHGRVSCLPVKLRMVKKTEGSGTVTVEAVPVHAKSGSIFALASADGYVMIDRNREGLKKGEQVLVERLD